MNGIVNKPTIADFQTLVCQMGKKGQVELPENLSGHTTTLDKDGKARLYGVQKRDGSIDGSGIRKSLFEAIKGNNVSPEFIKKVSAYLGIESNGKIDSKPLSEREIRNVVGAFKAGAYGETKKVNGKSVTTYKEVFLHNLEKTYEEGDLKGWTVVADAEANRVGVEELANMRSEPEKRFSSIKDGLVNVGVGLVKSLLPHAEQDGVEQLRLDIKSSDNPFLKGAFEKLDGLESGISSRLLDDLKNLMKRIGNVVLRDTGEHAMLQDTLDVLESVLKEKLTAKILKDVTQEFNREQVDDIENLNMSALVVESKQEEMQEEVRDELPRKALTDEDKDSNLDNPWVVEGLKQVLQKVDGGLKNQQVAEEQQPKNTVIQEFEHEQVDDIKDLNKSALLIKPKQAKMPEEVRDELPWKALTDDEKDSNLENPWVMEGRKRVPQKVDGGLENQQVAEEQQPKNTVIQEFKRNHLYNAKKLNNSDLDIEDRQEKIQEKMQKEVRAELQPQALDDDDFINPYAQEEDISIDESNLDNPWVRDAWMKKQQAMGAANVPGELQPKKEPEDDDECNPFAQSRDEGDSHQVGESSDNPFLLNLELQNNLPANEIRENVNVSVGSDDNDPYQESAKLDEQEQEMTSQEASPQEEVEEPGEPLNFGQEFPQEVNEEIDLKFNPEEPVDARFWDGGDEGGVEAKTKEMLPHDKGPVEESVHLNLGDGVEEEQLRQQIEREWGRNALNH